jgi:phage/plasmid-like protein (TIGR03299 family)
MSHELESMMFAGATPWHGLGKKVSGLQTAEEAIAAAGLDWEVEVIPIFTNDEGAYKKVPDKVAIRRVKDRRVYGIATPQYTPIQNAQAFQFFDGVIGEKKAVYETAGSLRNGERIWIMANLKGTVGVNGDEIKRYLILMNSHDGSLALQMFFSPVRVVCMNTLRMALAQASDSFYARHTIGIMLRVQSAQEILGLATKFYHDFMGQARQLAALALPAPKVTLMLNAAFKQPDSIKMEDVYNVTKIQMEKVKELIEVDRKEFPKDLHGTAWEAYNGIAKYTDYYRQYRSEAKDARLRGVWFGSGSDIKKRAWNYLTDLAAKK